MIKNLISEILKQSYKNDYSVWPVKHFPIFIKYKILLLYWQLLSVKQHDFQAEILLNLTALYETKKFIYSWFAHDVISCHWAPSWLTLQITSAVYSEVLASICYFIVSFSVL